MLEAIIELPPVQLARSLRRRLRRLRYEGRGSETDASVTSAELGFETNEWVPYDPSAYNWLRRALRGRKITRADVMVDFGCGKGRVLLQAARRYRFGRVIGVEISEALAEAARRNLAANPRVRDSCEVEIANCNAVDFEIPDDVTYAYFFNPFGGETFRRVLLNLVASLDRCPRRVTLIYANPVMADAVEALGRFELVDWFATDARRQHSPSTGVRVYESRDARDAT